MFSKRMFVGLALLLLIALGCGKHQKLLKSGDNQAKYAAAMDLYEDKDYYRALQLFKQLLNFYQGTAEGQKMQFYYAYCYYHQRDYVLASYYFKRFATNYPRSELAEEAMFMSAYCYYLDSPKSSLDQTNTFTAINELTLFMDMFPYSDRIERCRELIGQLQDKLMEKDYHIANLYYKMEDYEAAITSYNNLLKEYPDTKYKEDVLFRILKSNYHFASKSIRKKQEERFQSALDSYNELIFQFPETVHRKEAENIHENILKRVSNLDVTLNN
jgi:outer membrane protein assembly factor BamD